MVYLWVYQSHAGSWGGLILGASPAQGKGSQTQGHQDDRRRLRHGHDLADKTRAAGSNRKIPLESEGDISRPGRQDVVESCCNAVVKSAKGRVEKSGLPVACVR